MIELIECDQTISDIDADTVIEWLDRRQGWLARGPSHVVGLHEVQYYGESDQGSKIATIPTDPLSVVVDVADVEDTDIDDVAQDLRDYADRKEVT